MLDRKDVSDKYKWNLQDIYATEEAFEKDFKKYEQFAEDIKKFKNTLNTAQNLDAYFKFLEKNNIYIDKLFSYAYLLESEDISKEHAQVLLKRLEVVNRKITIENVGFEITKLKTSKLKEFANDPLLSYKKNYFEDLIEDKKHILSEKEEKVINSLSDTYLYEEIFDQFNDSELDYGKVKLSCGEVLKLTPENVETILRTEPREVRKKAVQKFFKERNRFQRTIGTNYLGAVKTCVAHAKIYKYKSALEQALKAEKVPTKVYKNLIKNYTFGLPLFKRYNLLRKKILGYAELHNYDTSVPLSSYKPKKATYEECYQTVIKALSVFGENYTNVLKEAFNNRWIDVMETNNKTTGAYMSGSFAVHPYVLLNFNGMEDYASTIAHELGHAVNSYFTCKNNRFFDSNNPIFLAEIASTVNEVLLNYYLIEQNKDNKEKQIFYLTEMLDLFVGTFFVQTKFAKFEEEVHRRIEQDEPLTVSDINKIYENVTKEYNQGVIVTDKNSGLGYLSIPHFYYHFYVYKYATGIISAINIVSNILQDKNYIKAYIKFLSSGTKLKTMETLKLAKIDLENDEAYKIAFKFIEDILSRLEKLV